MSKHIAYLTTNTVSCLKRIDAFIKNNKNYLHTIVIFKQGDLEETTLVYPILNTHSIQIVEFNQLTFNDSCFDLILPMTDKLFNYVLKRFGVDESNNLANKSNFISKTKAYGYDSLKTHDFAPTDYVVVKPKNSSGSFAHDGSDICYRKILFSDLAKSDIDFSNFIITEFIDGDIIGFNIIGNGQMLEINDTTEFEFKEIDSSPFFCVYAESGPNKFTEKLMFEAQRYVDFLNSMGYNKIPGFFGVQFIVKDNKFYPLDFNARNGPYTVEMSVNGLYQHEIFQYIPFFLNELTSDECLIKSHTKKIHHREYVTNGLRYLSSRIKTDLEPIASISLTGNGTSGCFRDNYITHIQILQEL